MYVVEPNRCRVSKMLGLGFGELIGLQIACGSTDAQSQILLASNNIEISVLRNTQHPKG